MSGVTVRVNPRVLFWARDSLGISREEAAAKIKADVSVIVGWETGAELPTLGPLRDLSQLYRRPLAAFLLPQVPTNPKKPVDLRAAPGATREDLSRKTKLALDRAFGLRRIAGDLEELEPGAPRTREVLDSATTSPEAAASAARARLGITIEQQLAWKTKHDAYQTWRSAMERRAGVLVFAMSMPMDEVRAFSISDKDGPPAIVLNSGDANAGKTFSLFHEFGHVLMGTGGICLPNEGPFRRTVPAVEGYCNQFSGAFLVPNRTLRALPEAIALAASPTMPSDDDLEAIADRFHVSKQVLWYRLRDVGLIDINRFAAKWTAWRRQPAPKRFIRTPRVGPKTLNRRGVRFTGLVFGARADENITTNDVLSYLEIHAGDLDEVESELRRRSVG
jgi:Zn-dependent peptidase ImmA (M78 family)/transcriptional regulator with XRE-family HTH domain